MINSKLRNILIIGATGLLGSALWDALKKSDTAVYGTYLTEKVNGLYHLDITNKKELFELFKKKLDVTILTAALTNVDYCESHRQEAWKINVEGTKNVIEACKQINSKLVFISTYYVFDGEKGFYNEEDIPSPLNYYSLTKVEGEKIVKQLEDYLIVRATNIYDLGYDEKNFVVRLIKTLRENKEIKVPNDQYTNPITATNLAIVIKELILKNKRGIYHIGGGEYISRYDFAIKVAKFFGLNANLIIAVDSKTLSQHAKRPLHCGLKTEKIEKELGIKPLNVEESLKLIQERINKVI